MFCCIAAYGWKSKKNRLAQSDSRVSLRYARLEEEHASTAIHKKAATSGPHKMYMEPQPTVKTKKVSIVVNQGWLLSRLFVKAPHTSYVYIFCTQQGECLHKELPYGYLDGDMQSCTQLAQSTRRPLSFRVNMILWFLLWRWLDGSFVHIVVVEGKLIQIPYTTLNLFCAFLWNL